jgi:phenylpropionate dioxygenase-like ring-hydroxylating dioxygenase large terminal subunit
MDLKVSPAHIQATNLPRRCFTDENWYRQELERIFYSTWLAVARDEDVAASGRLITREIGGESIVVSRHSDRRLHGFYNVCRHRGSRLLEEASGQRRVIRCPYHSWSYGLDGTLLAAPHCDSLPGFEKAANSLQPVELETWAGFIFVRLGNSAGPQTLACHLGELIERHKQMPLSSLRRVGSKSYDVAANWKIICENFCECYHCPSIHPELSRITFYRDSQNDAWFNGDLSRGAFSGGWMDLTEGFQSMTLTGQTSRPFLPGTAAADQRRIYYYLVFPNFFFSRHPDYLMVHTVWPLGVSRSRVLCEWFVEPAILGQGEIEHADAIGIWDIINRQDWHVCQLTQKGVESRAFQPGRYSEIESMVYDFDQYYRRTMDAL